MSPLRIGEPAPDFALPSSDGTTFRLSEARGRPVVVAFYPADLSRNCTKQMCAYSERWDDLLDSGAIVVGISRQDLASHERFIERHGLRVPLLADRGARVIKAYGMAGPLGHTKRGTVLIDAAGVVRWIDVSYTGLRFVGPADLLDRVRAL